MSLINWSDKYVTGIQEIDNQHKELVRIINELYDAMKQGSANDKTSGILDFLAKYTIEHFQTEEKLMRGYAYPAFTQHKAEHDKLVKKVQELLQKKDGAKLILTLELSKFLSDWLTQHILGQDLAYVSFFKAKGLVK